MTDEDRDGQYVFETLYRNAISTLELEYKKIQLHQSCMPGAVMMKRKLLTDGLPT